VLACGFSAARGDIIAMLDARPHRSAGDTRFLAPLLDGAGFVKALLTLDGAAVATLPRGATPANAS
jgi:hypothetical protein